MKKVNICAFYLPDSNKWEAAGTKQELVGGNVVVSEVHVEERYDSKEVALAAIGMSFEGQGFEVVVDGEENLVS